MQRDDDFPTQVTRPADAAGATCCNTERADEAKSILNALHDVMRRLDDAKLTLAAARLSPVIDAVEAEVMAVQCLLRKPSKG